MTDDITKPNQPPKDGNGIVKSPVIEALSSYFSKYGDVVEMDLGEKLDHDCGPDCYCWLVNKRA